MSLVNRLTIKSLIPSFLVASVNIWRSVAILDLDLGWFGQLPLGNLQHYLSILVLLMLSLTAIQGMISARLSASVNGGLGFPSSILSISVASADISRSLQRRHNTIFDWQNHDRKQWLHLLALTKCPTWMLFELVAQ